MLDSVLHAKVSGPIINTSVFSEFGSKKLPVTQFFLLSTVYSVTFANWYALSGHEEIYR